MNADDVNLMLAEHFPGAGANCVELGDTYAVASTELNELSIRPGNYVSGPTQFAIADAADNSDRPTAVAQGTYVLPRTEG